MQTEFIFGWNAATIGLIGMLVCTVIEVWGLWMQIRTVWRNRSGQSLSVFMVSYQITFLLIGLMYGLSKKDIGITVNSAALVAFLIPVFWGLKKFKRFTPTENALWIPLATVLCVVLVIPFKEMAFLIASSFSILFFLSQPFEIWRNKDSGVVEIKLLVVLFVSTIFWVLYGFGTNNWVLKITNPIFLAVLGLTIAVWIRYRNPIYRKF